MLTFTGSFLPLAERCGHPRCGQTRKYGNVIGIVKRSRGREMPSQPLMPGDPRSLSRFELLARLGEGGQGVVYLGRGTGPGEERVAVKVLRSDVDPMMLERLGG